MRSFSVRGIIAGSLLLFLATAIFSPFFYIPARDAAVGFFNPLLKILNNGIDAAGTVLDSWRPLGNAERRELENARLRLAEFEQQQQLAVAVHRQNSELRQILELSPLSKWQRLTAPVVARDPALFERRFRIGKGAAHGIYPGTAVMTNQHVIGKVVSVTRNTALVLTVLDPGCRLSVNIDALRVNGLLSGAAPAGFADRSCLLDLLPRDAEYREGLRVTTSGLSPTIPAGLPVGVLISWNDEKTADIVDGTYARLKMRSAADFMVRRFVTCIVPEAGTGDLMQYDYEE